MSVNPIKAWLDKNNAMGDVMQGRVKESAELKERYDQLMNAVLTVVEEEIKKCSNEFIDNYLKWLDENSHVEYHGAVRKVVLDADLDELRRHFDLFGKFKKE